MVTYIILAGSYDQAYRWAKTHFSSRVDWKYVDSIKVIKGLDDIRVIELGGFCFTPNYEEINKRIDALEKIGKAARVN